jgi:ABC-type nickel/cobalt efflux system permease component RcnA
LNLIEEIKEKDTLVILAICALIGVFYMNISTGIVAYAGLFVTLLSATGAAVYYRTAKKKTKTDVKPVKIS